MQRVEDNSEIFRKPNVLSSATGLLSIAVSSGKGGTGKTNVVANLGFAFAQLQRKVLILDGNLGLSNIGGLLGLRNFYTIEDLLNNHKPIGKVLFKGPGGMMILPGSPGNEKLARLNTDDEICLLEKLEQLAESFDVLLIDTAAGISANVMFFNLVAGESLIVTTPELTSISAAYALIKIMATEYRKTNFKILLNLAKNQKEAKEAYRTLINLADVCLKRVSLDYLGFIPFDKKLTRAVREQQLVAKTHPHSPSSKMFREMATYFIQSHKQAIRNLPVPRIESDPIFQVEEGNENKGSSI